MGVTIDTTDLTKTSKTGNGKAGYDANVVDVQDFFDRVLMEYSQGTDNNLPADGNVARSIVPAGTGRTSTLNLPLASTPPRFVCILVGSATTLSKMVWGAKSPARKPRKSSASVPRSGWCMGWIIGRKV